jgi:FkbM family methyltransferase
MLTRAVSKLIISYVRHSPVERGKWRLLRFASGVLLVEIEPGVVVRVAHPEDSMEYSVVFGWKEYREHVMFLSFARLGMTVFDVGANLGVYSLLAAKRVGKEGRVHAFEPTPRTVQKLRANATLNRFSNIISNQLALSDASGEQSFYLSAEDDQNSLAAVSDTFIRVPTIALDDYIEKNRVLRVDLLKIDVEGAEMNVFKGAQRLLSRPDAPMILLEVNPSALERMGASREDVAALLQQNGYRLRTLADHGSYQNVLASKSECV